MVDASLLRSGLYVAGPVLTMSATRPRDFPAERNVQRSGRTRVFNPAMNNYKTKDGRYLQLVGVEMHRHFPSIFKALGLTEKLLPEVKNFPKSRQLMISEMDAAFAEKTEEEWIKILDSHDVWYTRVRRYEEMPYDEQAEAVNAFVQLPGMKSKVLAPPVQFSNIRHTPARRAPTLGEHTDEVLGQLRSKL